VERAPHFIQVGSDPAVIGEGTEDLACGCGDSVLVKGYIPANLLAIDIQCGVCGGITSTPVLPDGATPPYDIVPIDRRSEPLPRPVTVARLTALASREEIQRLASVFGPRTPTSDVCVISEETLDQVAANYDGLTGGRLDDDLAALAGAGTGAQAGVSRRPLAWAIQHLRRVHASPGWACTNGNEDAVSTTLVAAFCHFVACWSQHPLFGAMARTAADRGFSLHAMAQFGAAKCLVDSGNRVGFALSQVDAGRISGLRIAVGETAGWDVEVRAFDDFDWPHGREWNAAILRAAVGAALAASQGRLNLRHPGMLILSAGAVTGEFEQPLVDAIRQTLRVQGRRHRGVAAISAILPKFLPSERPDRVSFGYRFFPLQNAHFAGGAGVQIGAAGDRGPR
jgi:hypothetical protein